MSYEVEHLVLGPISTNCYLLGDPASKQAIAIDPGWDGHLVKAAAEKRGWSIKAIWFTHAHFDHISGGGAIQNEQGQVPPAAMHPDDEWLWDMKGGGGFLDMELNPGPKPVIKLKDGMLLTLGENSFQVLHAPGHTPGHVMFYSEANAELFSGDVLFQHSIGRTDIPNGDHVQLLDSIQRQVLTLPDTTTVYCGHGPSTSVGHERAYNPFLK